MQCNLRGYQWRAVFTIHLQSCTFVLAALILSLTVYCMQLSAALANPTCSLRSLRACSCDMDLSGTEFADALRVNPLLSILSLSGNSIPVVSRYVED